MYKRAKQMDTREMMLLLQLLMHDIRAGYESGPSAAKDKRAWKALDLVDELSNISNNHDHKDYVMVSCISWHKFYESIGVYLTGRFEGRYLNMSICDGGYDGLEYFHKLSETDFKSRSPQFKKQLKEHSRYVHEFVPASKNKK